MIKNIQATRALAELTDGIDMSKKKYPKNMLTITVR